MTEQQVIDFQFRGQYIPAHMVGAVLDYFNNHLPPGDFLRSLLENDLLGAYRNADDKNFFAMPVWVAFLYNEAPIGSYGSPENVNAWITQWIGGGGE